MRKKILAGNWKMNKELAEAMELSLQVTKVLGHNKVEGVDIILAPPSVFLEPMAQIVAGSSIALAGQNCSTEVSGAYTGEVSAAMLKSVGASAVLVGHSERRSYFSESDSDLAAKVDRALEAELQPIFCFGETLTERQSGKEREVVSQQIRGALGHLSQDQWSHMVLAYEPVWAIGTGETATPEQAQEIHHYVRNLLAEEFGEDIGANCPILYGGSCKPGNAAELFSQPDVDGGLIGGASLNADDFAAIANSF